MDNGQKPSTNYTVKHHDGSKQSVKTTNRSINNGSTRPAINTNWYSYHILKNSPSDKCRLCNEHPETIEHITTGCPKLAQTIYLDRHNAVSSTLHWSLCKQMNFERAENWWEHQPEPAMEN